MTSELLLDRLEFLPWTVEQLLDRLRSSLGSLDARIPGEEGDWRFGVPGTGVEVVHYEALFYGAIEYISAAFILTFKFHPGCWITKVMPWNCYCFEWIFVEKLRDEDEWIFVENLLGEVLAGYRNPWSCSCFEWVHFLR